MSELIAAARAILPENIDAELPSAITSDDPLAGLSRMTAIGDRWERFRATLDAAERATQAEAGLAAREWRALASEAYAALDSMPLCAMGHAVETRRRLRAALAATPKEPVT